MNSVVGNLVLLTTMLTVHNSVTHIEKLKYIHVPVHNKPLDAEQIINYCGTCPCF